MTDKFASQLLAAADEFDGMTEPEIKALLRRAALRVDNRTQEAGKTILIREIMAVMDDFAAEQKLSRDEAVNAALLDWAIGMGLIQVDDLDDEEGE